MHISHASVPIGRVHAPGLRQALKLGHPEHTWRVLHARCAQPDGALRTCEHIYPNKFWRHGERNRCPAWPSKEGPVRDVPINSTRSAATSAAISTETTRTELRGEHELVSNVCTRQWSSSPRTDVTVQLMTRNEFVAAASRVWWRQSSLLDHVGLERNCAIDARVVWVCRIHRMTRVADIVMLCGWFRSLGDEQPCSCVKATSSATRDSNTMMTFHCAHIREGDVEGKIKRKRYSAQHVFVGVAAKDKSIAFHGCRLFWARWNPPEGRTNKLDYCREDVW